MNPPTFRLIAEKRGFKLVRGKWVDDDEARKTLAPQPSYLNPLEGTGMAVGAAASRLNDEQIRSGYLHYLFSAQMLVEEPV